MKWKEGSTGVRSRLFQRSENWEQVLSPEGNRAEDVVDRPSTLLVKKKKKIK